MQGLPPGYTLDPLPGEGERAASNLDAWNSAPTPPVRSAAPRPPSGTMGRGGGWISDTRYRGTGTPVSDGGAVAREIFGIEPTSTYRSPNHPLSRANPGSYHTRTRAAFDMRPLADLSFRDAVERIQQAGYELLEARDEVNDPTSHATGPHWHFAVAEGPGRRRGPDVQSALPPGPDGSGEAPNLPPGYTLDPVEPVAAPSVGEGSAPLIDALPVTGGVQGLPGLPPPAPPPNPSGALLADPGGYRAPSPEGTPQQYASADPAILSRLEAAFDRGAPRAEIVALAQSSGAEVTPQWLAALDRSIAYRRANPGAAGGYNTFVPGERAAAPDADGRFRSSGAEATEHVPGITERIGHGFAALVSPLLGHETGREAGANMDALMSNPLNPVSAIEYAQNAEARRNRAMVEGRTLDYGGNTLDASLGALGIIPGFRRAREGVELAARAISELEQLAARAGVQEVGPAADTAIAGLVRSQWGSLTPETRAALGPGADTVSPARIAEMRAAANPGPSLIERGVGAVRRRFGRRAPAEAMDAAVSPSATAAREAVEGLPTEEPSGVVRLYRGEGAPDRPRHPNASTEGSWFTTNQRIAENYAERNGGHVVALDLPRADADRLLAESAARARRDPLFHGSPYTAEVPRDLAAAARPLREMEGATNLPARVPDRIDIAKSPPPVGYTLDPIIGRVSPLGEQPTPDDLATVARSIRPEDVRPIGSNRVETAEEAARANPGTFRDVRTPSPASMLEMRRVPHRAEPGEFSNHRGPLDAEAYLRSIGGVRDDAGELRHMGFTNSPRPGASGDRVLGPIVTPRGLAPDEAARRLWEAGYLPDYPTRPAIADLYEVLRAGRNGTRTWHPDDLGEVAGFETAQAQRLQADAAADAGRPIAERVGSPLSRADLDALSPPATAYEDLPQIGGKVGNINLANIESGADIRRLLHNVEERFGGFDGARRGKITHAETRALADELGMTADDLLRRRPGQALNAEQALAARQLLAKSSDEVLALAARATGPAASDVSRAAFSEALLRHAAIHEQVSGATAEAGRALSQFRAAARSRAIGDRIHQAAVDGAGGKGRIEDIAEGILNLQRQGFPAGQVNAFAVNAIKPRLRDKLVELWYNLLLSGPQTHVVNTLSNSMTAALQIPEQVVASAIGQARRGVRAMRGKEDDFDRVLASEIGPRVVGLMQGAREGVGAFGRTLRTGDVPDFVTKVESRSQRAISGLKGEIVRVPSRLLAAEDEFFKATARRMELNGLAVRQATKEGLRGEALKARIADLVRNPPDAMLARVLDTARYLTFQRPLGKVGQRISATTQDYPLLKLFIPFIRTPTNILKFGLERSPFAPVLREVRDNLRAGGERRALAMSRIALGTGLGMVVAQWVADGVITGSPPKDRAQRDLMLADGWQPYSIRIGGTYYSYQRLDPLAMTLGTAANLRGTWEAASRGDAGEVTAQLISSIIGNLADKTWLSGFGDLMGVIDDPDRNLASFVSRLAGSIAVPTGVAQVARTMDPTMRETRGDGVIDSAMRRVQSRIPGLSDDLPARLDVWGQPINSGGGLGPDIASPIWTSRARNDPVTAELLQAEASLGRPSRTLQGRRLTDAEYASYQQTAGRYVRDDLMEAVAAPEWRAATREDRESRVQEIVRDARADARADLGLASPEDMDGTAPAPTGGPSLPPGYTLDPA